MLSPSEFSVGCLADISRPCLVLPRRKFEHACLVTTVTEAPTAICLEGDHRFRSLPCTDNTNWKGIVIPGIGIELDENSIFDPDDHDAPMGAMIRRGTELVLTARSDSGHYPGGVPVRIMDDLPPSHFKMAAAFSRWNVVLWRGDEKQILFEVDSNPINHRGKA